MHFISLIFSLFSHLISLFRDASMFSFDMEASVFYLIFSMILCTNDKRLNILAYFSITASAYYNLYLALWCQLLNLDDYHILWFWSRCWQMLHDVVQYDGPLSSCYVMTCYLKTEFCLLEIFIMSIGIDLFLQLQWLSAEKWDAILVFSSLSHSFYIWHSPLRFAKISALWLP